MPTPQTPTQRPEHPHPDSLAERVAAERAELLDPVWWRQDLGMATAEYAIATLAACGFAGLLLLILRSDEVRAALTGIITRALSLA